MNEALQFVCWLCQKIKYGIVTPINAILGLMNAFRDELKTNTAIAIYLWFLVTAIGFALAMAIISICCLIAGHTNNINFDKNMNMGLGLYGIAALSILIISAFRAIYASFKDDQARIFNLLKQNHESSKETAV